MQRLDGKVVVITGAGSGVGQATAWKLAQEGASLAIVGRTEKNLQETAAKLDTAKTLLFPCDVSKENEVAALAKAVKERFGRVDVLVNSAGTNIPRRALSELSVEDFKQVIDINLTGAFLCIRAFLPFMREQGEGTIVNVSSIAGLQSSVVAGSAYAASKFGMRALNQSVNLEEQRNNIRACAIFPGEINTPIIDRRPVPSSPEARAKMLQGEDLAECIALVVMLPQRAVVDELIIRPLTQTRP